MDKPATGAAVLEQAHNDWLEWASTTGAVGVVALVLGVIGLAVALAPRRVRRMRFEYRYALAGVGLVLVATGLHEIVGFGLQTPLNRYLLATWVGLLWGLDGRIRDLRKVRESTPDDLSEKP
jgi:O-antigen ligase